VAEGETKEDAGDTEGETEVKGDEVGVGPLERYARFLPKKRDVMFVPGEFASSATIFSSEWWICSALAQTPCLSNQERRCPLMTVSASIAVSRTRRGKRLFGTIMPF